MSAPDLDRAAERAYYGFIKSAQDRLPPHVQEWRELPDVVKKDWMAAAAEARRED